MINPGEAFYLISREAAWLVCYTNRRPEVVIVSPELYNQLVETYLITCHILQNARKIDHEMRMCGMRLDVGREMRGMKFILGNEYDLEEISGRKENTHEQKDEGVDHPEAGRGADLAVREVPVPDGQLGAEAAGVQAGADDLRPGCSGSEV